MFVLFIQFYQLLFIFTVLKRRMSYLSFDAKFTQKNILTMQSPSESLGSHTYNTALQTKYKVLLAQERMFNLYDIQTCNLVDIIETNVAFLRRLMLVIEENIETEQKELSETWIRVMVFNTTFNNISAISWWSFLLVEETRVPGENHRPVKSH